MNTKKTCDRCRNKVSKYIETKDGEIICQGCYDKYYFTCENCNEVFSRGAYNDIITSDGEVICQGCYDEYYFTCENCVLIFHNNDLKATTFNGDLLCESCYNDHYFTCARCYDVYHNSNAIRYHSSFICQDCYNDSFFTCEGCNEVYHIDDAYYHGDCCLCSSCYDEDHESEYIYGAHYKPEAYFYGDGEKEKGTRSNNENNLYMGIELEIDNVNDKDELSNLLHDLSENERFFYLKEDGSLEEGFEIVSHPMTILNHKKIMDWKKRILTPCLEHKAKSHDAGTCGLHIHFNKSFTGKTKTEKDLNQLKLIYVFEKFWSQLAVFSRRNDFSYCKKLDVEHLELKDQKNEVEKKGKYLAVNLSNEKTIEIRLWRGTLDYKTFYATLELTNNMIKFLKKVSIARLAKISWSRFMVEVLAIEKTDYLKDYLEKKNLI